MIDFNVNHYVLVKLTAVGRKEIERQNRELRLAHPHLQPAIPIKEDAEGWSKWQMHSLMNRFGHMMILGCESPFEMDIKIDVAV